MMAYYSMPSLSVKKVNADVLPAVAPVSIDKNNLLYIPYKDAMINLKFPMTVIPLMYIKYLKQRLKTLINRSYRREMLPKGGFT
jgi:hypothetical protein